jgi:hypothetical protein
MERLDEKRLRELMEWLAEAEEDDEDNESDAVAAAKADFERKVASGEVQRAEKDPPKGGHKRPMPFDYSGAHPEQDPLGGKMSPKMAGERAKAIMVMGRVIGFVEKYSQKAVDKFGGASAPDDSAIAYKGAGHGVGGGALGVRKPAATTTSVADDPRAGEKGNVKGMSQMMSKDKVKAMIEKLPMMPSSQMMFAVRAIGNYVWKIHATMRQEIRDLTKKQLSGQGQATKNVDWNPRTGQIYDKPKVRVDTESEPYKAKLAALSKEFDEDSTNIKADLNMLAAVSGSLKRSGGFGGAADKTFLDKIIKSYVDKEGTRKFKTPEIVPQGPDVALPPELAKMSGWNPPEAGASADKPKGSSKGVTAKGPIVRKKSASEPVKNDVSDDEADEFLKGIADSINRPFDRYLNSIMEIAGTDYSPKWWDEL